MDSLEAAGVPDTKLLRVEFFKEGKLVEARELVQDFLMLETENVELNARSLLLLSNPYNVIFQTLVQEELWVKLKQCLEVLGQMARPFTYRYKYSVHLHQVL